MGEELDEFLKDLFDRLLPRKLVRREKVAIHRFRGREVTVIMGSTLSNLKKLHLSRKSSSSDVSVKDSPSVPSSRSAQPSEDGESRSSPPVETTTTVEPTEEASSPSPVPNDNEETRCAICLDDFVDAKTLHLCGHIFCTSCIDEYFQRVKPQCPCCFVIYGEIRGNQPEDGEMFYKTTRHRLPGYKDTSTGTIEVYYVFPDGVQGDRHPHPGVPYDGTVRKAFLPDNDEGRHVLSLLTKAFQLGLTFTVGESRTTGCANVVTWNDIHHKTSYRGGSENFGYPDPTYLNRVQQELAAKGIH